MSSTRHHTKLGSVPPMSRVDWAIARYNWYRVCGLLDDLPQQTIETSSDGRSPHQPPPKPHLKWYPLSKPDDDIATTYPQPASATQWHRYSHRVEDSRSRTVNRAQTKADDPRTWSRVDWAIARYNWYRACGLLDDMAPPTAETTRYQRSPDPPPPKPHLKWYPLSKSDDDAVTACQHSVAATSPVQYCQRVVSAEARAILARYQAEKEALAKGTSLGVPFDPSKHPRDRIGRFTLKGGGSTLSVSITSASDNTKPDGRHSLTTSTTKPKNEATANQGQFSVPPEKFTDTIDEKIDLNLLRHFADGHSALGEFTDRTMMFALEHPDLWAAFVERHGLPSAKDWEMVQAWGWTVESMASAPKGGPYFQIDPSTKTIKIATQSHAWGTAWWNYVDLTPPEQADALRQALHAVKAIGKPKNLGTLGTHDTRNASGTPYWKAWAEATALRRQFLNEIYTDLKWQLVLGGAGKALGRVDDLAAGLAALGKQARAAARRRFPNFIKRVIGYTTKAGRKLKPEEIEELQDYCKTLNLKIVVDPARVEAVGKKLNKKAGAFFDGHTGEIVLGENPTLYEFLHEFGHFDQWDRMGRDMSKFHHAKFNPEWRREKYVRDLLMDEFKEHLHTEDIKHAEAYLESVTAEARKRTYGYRE